MTETQTIEVADSQVDTEVQSDVEIDNQADNDLPEGQDAQEDSSSEGQGDAEWPKKAVNALNREKKNSNKLRAKLQDVQSRLEALEAAKYEQKVIDANEFETMDDYLKAGTKSEVESAIEKYKADQQKAQLTQEQAALIGERDQYITEQARDVSQSIPDFTTTMTQHVQVLDNLPPAISDIFYSIDNAPLAAYVLAKEGKLNAIAYANPTVAAIEIMSAQQRGMNMVSKPRQQVSQAPQPMTAARGMASTTKDLMKGDVLKNLGLKS